MNQDINAVLRGERRLALVTGDNRAEMYEMPPNSVHSIATSPPYFGLRTNNVLPLEWAVKPGCSHEWRPGIKPGITGGIASPKVQIKGQDNFQIVGPSQYEECIKCGGWRGELGQELTVRKYVEHICEIFDHIMRVLHPTGNVWLNLGDSYAGSGKGPQGHNGFQGAEKRQGFVGTGPRITDDEYKPKDTMLVPYRVARALQKRGWYVRATSPWIKPNAMSHPVRDRQNVAVEWVFHLTRERTYFYDPDAVMRPGTSTPVRNWRTSDPWYDSLDELIDDTESYVEYLRSLQRDKGTAGGGVLMNEQGKIISVAAHTSRYQGEHFSTFSEKLVTPMIQAATPKQVCSACHMPFVQGRRKCQHISAGVLPGTFLDPFCGVATACRVALTHGFRAIGIDLNAKYIGLAQHDLRRYLEPVQAPHRS